MKVCRSVVLPHVAQSDLEGTWELCCLEFVRRLSSLGSER